MRAFFSESCPYWFANNTGEYAKNEMTSVINKYVFTYSYVWT